MPITLNYFNISRLFSCALLILSLSACTEAIITQEHSQNYNIPIHTNEVIRVIADRAIVSKDPFSDYNWNYITQAKIKTEEIFTHLGYTVVDMGLASDNNGNPTLIAIVNAQQDPLKTNFIHYSINLYRPLSSNNPLFFCRKEQQDHNICIAPETIENSQKLYTAQCTYSGTANVAAFIMKYCIKSAFTTYPNGSNKRIIYTTREQPLIKDLDKT